MDALYSLHLVYKQTDLELKTEGMLDRRQVEMYLKKIYQELEAYIAGDHHFLSAIQPHPVPKSAPAIVRDMSHDTRRAGVGPMAAVAGAIADHIGKRLAGQHRIIFCNNGGDIYYKSPEKQWIILKAPGSPFDETIKIEVPPAMQGKGLCTSSGIFGHSVNMGRAYSVSILADSACLADAWATSISNQIHGHLDLERVLEYCKKESDIKGVAILVDHYLGIWGDIRLSRVG